MSSWHIDEWLSKIKKKKKEKKCRLVIILYHSKKHGNHKHKVEGEQVFHSTKCLTYILLVQSADNAINRSKTEKNYSFFTLFSTLNLYLICSASSPWILSIELFWMWLEPFILHKDIKTDFLYLQIRFDWIVAFT